MLQINKQESKSWYLTLTEKTTIANPTYLFSLTHRLTNVAYNFILADTSSYTTRYNKFDITEGTTVTLDAGEYEYEIYAQTSPTNLDPNAITAKIAKDLIFIMRYF